MRLDAVVADDQGTESRHSVAPRLPAAHEELAVRIAVTESEHEAVVAEDPRERDAGIPVAEPVADAEAELVRIRDLEVVVH